MNSKVIVALDFNSKKEAQALVEQLDPTQCALKVGNEMFTGFGSQFVKYLIDLNFKVFLDLKYHDIPNTVAKACAMAAELGVWMVNMHASGGLAMMRAAYNAVQSYGDQKPLLIAVTVLTSMDSQHLPEIGVQDTVAEQVQRLSTLAYRAGLDGVVCSALEAAIIKNLYPDNFLTVTPGIRLMGDSADDQARIVTPVDAFNMGSDYLVIGRSITRSSNPQQTLEQIIESIRREH